MASSGETSFGRPCQSGHEVPAGATICPTCGSPVTPANESASAGWPAEPAGWPPQPEPPTSAPPLTELDEEPATDGFALASLVLGILWVYWVGSIIAIVFGHLALSRTRKSGEKGRGLALAGLIFGYLGLLLGIVLLIAVIHTH